MNKFDIYKNLKRILGKHTYKEYPLGMVCGSLLAKHIWNPKRSNFRFMLKSMFFDVKTIRQLIDRRVICVYSIERNDYIDLAKSYFPEEHWNHVPLEFEVLKIPNFRDLKVWTKCLFILWREFKNLDIADFIVVYSCVVLAHRIIDEIENFDIETNAFIAFNSSYELESFFTYYFRLRDIPTYSLQHGMYFNYKGTLPVDVINYENVCAKELLVWGRFSKKQIEKLTPKDTTLKVVGYKKSEVTKRKSIDAYLIVLPRESYFEDSCKLIDKLVSSGFNFIIKPHPTVEKRISEYCRGLMANINCSNKTSLKKLLAENKYLGVIGFNTTAIFEAALYEQNVYYYDSDNAEFDNPGFYQFNEANMHNRPSSEMLLSDLFDELDEEYLSAIGK